MIELAIILRKETEDEILDLLTEIELATEDEEIIRQCEAARDDLDLYANSKKEGKEYLRIENNRVVLRASDANNGEN